MQPPQTAIATSTIRLIMIIAIVDMKNVNVTFCLWSIGEESVSIYIEEPRVFYD